MKLDNFLQDNCGAWFKDGTKFAECRREQNKWDGRLTSMQEEVLQSEDFMNLEKNIVIQGATSSGKTLLAEIAAMRQILDPEIDERKVLFLVPLRAMVTAQCMRIRQDFRDIKLDRRELQIYESSADYQDHDAQILGGNYDIAVIVYEKFFSMLNSQGKMLDNCGLVVVDELQMLHTQERGPKMEFSIMKVLEAQKKSQQIRVIGLTTSATNVEKLCEWLHAVRLGNDSRPVGLKQYFVSYNSGSLGKVQEKYIPGERDASEPAQEAPEDGQADSVSHEENKVDFEVLPPSSTYMSGDYYKNELLFKILDSVEEGKKVLVFVNTKRKARECAKGIASRYPKFEMQKPDDAHTEDQLQYEILCQSLTEAMNEFSDEDDVNELSRLVPRGVALHHSGLPAAVREAVENSFRDENGQVRLIVCTETLMVGMNMPADIVILYDNQVYRGQSEPRKMTVQEYQNFSGRAGRLGFRDMGESYLLTDKPHRDFKLYTANETVEICSPFVMNDIMGIAPYFMSWIGAEKNVITRIREGLREGFCYNHCEEKQIASLSDEILDVLEKSVNLQDTNQAPVSLVFQQGNVTRNLTRLGVALSPYAFTLETNNILIRYAIEHREELEIDNLQFEFSNTQEKKPPRQLLELLYALCQCTEMSQNPVLRGPAESQSVRILNNAVQKYLQKIYLSPDIDNHIAKGESRTLEQIAYSISIVESHELRGAMRAIILALWMAGYPMKFIRESTNFNIPIATSDVERLSETMAYLMEAFSKCEDELKGKSSDARQLYTLSTSMKYGVPYSLVPLANTRARTITRSLLLQIDKDAKASGKKPKEFILANTNPRYTALLKALRERERVFDYPQQLANKNLEVPNRFRELIPNLQEFNAHARQNLDFVVQNLWEFFNKIGALQQSDPKWELKTSRKENRIKLTFYPGDGTIREIHLQVIRPEADEKNSWLSQIQKFGEETERENKKTGIPTYEITVLCGTPPVGEKNLPGNQLVISSEILGILMLACLIEDVKDIRQFLYRILSDLKGAFILGGTNFFNEYGQLWPLVKDYRHPKGSAEKGAPKLFYFSGIFNYQKILEDEHKHYYADTSWGENAGANDMSGSDNTVVFYHPAMRYSRSAQKNIEHGILLFHEEYTEEVENLKPKMAVEIRDKEMTDILEDVSRRLRSPQVQPYQYDVGISFRGAYMKQMHSLRDELVRRNKKVLCMNTEDFAAKVSGNDFPTQLTKEFSQCRHIIACNTHDYDESPYTFVEYNVIIDKLAQALKKHEDFPIYTIQIPGVEPGERLGAFFRHSFHYTYDADVAALADQLVHAMDDVENRKPADRKRSA